MSHAICRRLASVLAVSVACAACGNDNDDDDFDPIDARDAGRGDRPAPEDAVAPRDADAAEPDATDAAPDAQPRDADPADADDARADAGFPDAAPDLGPPPCGPEPEPGSVVYVDGSAPAGGDGMTWATSLDDLQAALAAATAGQQVWVAEGTYRPNAPADPDNVTNTEREVSFVVPSGVEVLGGFTATEERACERDVEAFVTTLSGDLNADDLDGDADGISDDNLDDNSFAVVRLVEVDANTRVDGFTITGGNVIGGASNGDGGGLYNENGSPTVANVIFVDNHATGLFTAGGAAASNGGDPQFRNVTFELNDSASNAGGLYVTGAGAAVVDGARFVGNRGVSAGGGMYVLGGEASATVRNTDFEANVVTTGGGGNGNGGGLSVDAAEVTLGRVRFVDNEASVVGGGTNVRNGGIRASHVVFAGNQAGSRGGAIDVSSGGVAVVTMQYVLMTDNEAPNGGAVGARRELRLSHATIYGNRATAGAGGAVYVINQEGPVRIYNSVLWDNSSTSGGAVVQGGLISVSRSVFQGSGGSPWEDRPADRGNDGGGNVDQDPQVVDDAQPAGADGVWGTADDGLRLALTSVGVDRATGADYGDIDDDSSGRDVPSDFADIDGDGDVNEEIETDLAGNPRRVGRAADLGAFETPGVPAGTPAILRVDADATGAGDGTSWADAFPELRDALTAAQAADEVWVAAGTYVPGDDRADRFELVPGVGVYGGFVGTESMRSQRNADPATNDTTLSGEIDAAGTSDNTRHVVVASGAGPDAILDGFTITRGDDFRSGAGGYGGGVYAYSSAATLARVRIVENRGGTGGGVYVAGGSDMHLRDLVVADNTGWEGGGVHVTGARLEIAGARFERNSGGSGGGGIQVNRDGHLVISHAAFFENAAVESLSSPGPGGGGILNTSGAVEGHQLVFVENSAVLGGAVAGFGSGHTRLGHVTMVANDGSFGGGVSSWNGARIDLASAVLWDNELNTLRSNPRGAEILASTSGSSGGDVYASHVLVDGGLTGAGVDICDPRCQLVDDGGNVSGDPSFVDATDPDGADDRLGTVDDGLRLGAASPAENAGATGDPYDLDRDGDVAERTPDFTDIDADGDREEDVPTDVAGQTRFAGAGSDMGAYERP